MKSSLPNFQLDRGREVYSGGQAVLKGGLEVTDGLHLFTGCPGGPWNDYFDGIRELSDLLSENGVVWRAGINERSMIATLQGTQWAGCRGLGVMTAEHFQHVTGVVRQLVTSGPIGEGGSVLVIGDDPAGEAMAGAQDVRLLAAHAGLPLIEPTTTAELKDWINLAYRLGRSGGMPIGMLVGRLLAEGGAVVEARLNQWPEITPEQRRQISLQNEILKQRERYVPLGITTRKRRFDQIKRNDALIAEARRLNMNAILVRAAKGQPEPIGFIASGAAYRSLVEALELMGLSGKLPLLKLGLVWPLDERLLRDFAEMCEQIIVIEERGDFLESQIRSLLAANQDVDPTMVFGRSLPGDEHQMPVSGGLHPSSLMIRLAPLLRERVSAVAVPDDDKAMAVEVETGIDMSWSVEVPTRSPMLCGGCPHRDASSVLQGLQRDLLDTEYMQRVHNRSPIELIIHGDSGCASLLRYEPFARLLHLETSEGMSADMTRAISQHASNRQLVIMGDATFFHSGSEAIGRVMLEGGDAIFLIMHNGSAAYSGQQPHPAQNQSGSSVEIIERRLRGMRIRDANHPISFARVNPEDRSTIRAALERAALAKGVHIIIADKECGITHHRQKQQERAARYQELDYLPSESHIIIAAEVCEYCLECTRQTGCPGLKIESSDYGPKIQTDPTTCVDDAACARLQVCPSFEKISIQRRQAPPKRGTSWRRPPAVAAATPVHAAQGIWRAQFVGLGGQGIRMLVKILAIAGHEMGYHVAYRVHSGSAVRTDTVSAQMVFTHVDRAGEVGPVIPFGQCDTLFGMDVIEVARTTDPLRDQRGPGPQTRILLNADIHPTSGMLLGSQSTRVYDEALSVMQQRHAPAAFWTERIDKASTHLFGHAHSANLVMLGAAYQRGDLPVKGEALERAIKRVCGDAFAENNEAFQLGRHLALGARVNRTPKRKTAPNPRRTLRRCERLLRLRLGQVVARQYTVRVRRTMHALRGVKDGPQVNHDLAVRAYDCVLWGGIEYLKRYLRRIRQTRHRDRLDRGLALTASVVRNLAQVMLIKDEPFVAELLTRPEKLRADRLQYQINPNRGDRIDYRHFHRPEFVLFGKRWRFRWQSRLWQLRLMSRATFLRDLLPAWHRREREFRDWYEKLIDQLDGPMLNADGIYDQWLNVLGCVEPVRGFREVIYPKMRAAQTQVDALLNQSVMVDAAAFNAAMNRERSDAAESDTASTSDDRTGDV